MLNFESHKDRINKLHEQIEGETDIIKKFKLQKKWLEEIKKYHVQLHSELLNR